MGISTEATRQRVKRGTLPTERDEDGNVFVLLTPEGTRRDGDGTRGDADGTNDGTDASLVASLLEQVEYLKETVAKRDEEIRRRDHLLAAALERIPALEAPPETREGHVAASEEPYRIPAPPRPETSISSEQQEPSSRRSWWRQLLDV